MHRAHACMCKCNVALRAPCRFVCFQLAQLEDAKGDASSAALTAASTLDKPTQELIRLIFDHDMFKQAMATMEIGLSVCLYVGLFVVRAITIMQPSFNQHAASLFAALSIVVCCCRRKEDATGKAVQGAGCQGFRGA